MRDRENIIFELSFTSVYPDHPPGARIYVDDHCAFDGKIAWDQTIRFRHTLDFGMSHQLRIERYGKEKSRPINDIHQTLILDKVKIDGVDIRNIIWSRSYNEPDYPESYSRDHPNLEKLIIAETHFGFNGTWRLNFTSPFYKFVMDCVSGKLRNVPIY